MTRKGKLIPGFGYEVPEYAYKPELRIHGKDQITDPSQVVRGKVIRHCTWVRTLGGTVSYDAVVLSGPSPKRWFSVLYLDRKGDPTLVYELRLENVSIVQDPDDGVFNNIDYLVNTGRTMSNDEIDNLLKRLNSF